MDVEATFNSLVGDLDYAYNPSSHALSAASL